MRHYLFGRKAGLLILVMSGLTLLCLRLLLQPYSAHASLRSPSRPNILGSGVNGVQVFVEPAAGEQVILNALNQAHSSIDVELYLLTDNAVISALENAATRGLHVRVMLESHPYGGGSPDQILQQLQSYGVSTEYTNPAFNLTHEKAMIIDATTAYIMTCNLAKSALGGSPRATNREYGIIDANATDVKTVSDIFNADWNRISYSLDNNNIVLSPVNARSDFTDLINSAQSSLVIEAEEMQDTPVEQAIVSAEKRGVNVQVILPSGSSSNANGIATLDQGGVQVREDPTLYMHAKMLVVDGKLAFVGSENISSYSLDQNRELGILVSDQSVLSTLQSTFQSDWSSSTAA